MGFFFGLFSKSADDPDDDCQDRNYDKYANSYAKVEDSFYNFTARGSEQDHQHQAYSQDIIFHISVFYVSDRANIQNIIKNHITGLWQ